MSRWIIMLVFVLGAACSPSTTDTTGLSDGSELSSLKDLPQGIPASLRQELEQGAGGYFILQFNTLPDEAARLELEQSGILLGDFVPENAFQAYLPADALPTLEELIATGDLRYAGPIPPEAKLQPELAAKIEVDPLASYEIVVQLFAEPPQSVLQQIESIMDVTGKSFGPMNIIEGKVKGIEISNIVVLPLVKWVEERIPADLGGG